MRARDVNRAIESRGGELARQRGSHRMYIATVNGVTARTTVPQHPGDIPKGLLRAIERDMEPVLARSLSDAGYSMRDIAGALRMTAGRVSQLLSEPGSSIRTRAAASGRYVTKTHAAATVVARSSKSGKTRTQSPSDG